MSQTCISRGLFIYLDSCFYIKLWKHHSHVKLSSSQVHALEDFVSWTGKKQKTNQTCKRFVCIQLLESPCPSVRWFVTKFQTHHMHSPYIHACFSFRIIDVCIIHTCTRVKDRGTWIYASYMHVSGSRVIWIHA